MRMRKKKNLVPRMEACGGCLVRDPFAMRGQWRTLMPQARELRVELGCGKGGFLFVELFDQPPLALFVITLDLGKCIHVLNFSCIIYIICVFHLRKRAFPLFFFFY